eukprot:11774228-Alexandrium_andersonii.AAC.1
MVAFPRGAPGCGARRCGLVAPARRLAVCRSPRPAPPSRAPWLPRPVAPPPRAAQPGLPTC